jgi:hypothetical protein
MSRRSTQPSSRIQRSNRSERSAVGLDGVAFGRVGVDASDSATLAGYVVGAGVEWVLPFLKNVTAKAEYLYVDYGTHRFFNPPITPGNCGCVVADVRTNDSVFRVGLNYHFNWFGRPRRNSDRDATALGWRSGPDKFRGPFGLGCPARRRLGRAGRRLGGFLARLVGAHRRQRLLHLTVEDILRRPLVFE